MTEKIEPCKECKKTEVIICNDGGVLCEWQPYVIMCKSCLWVGTITTGATPMEVIAEWNAMQREGEKDDRKN